MSDLYQPLDEFASRREALRAQIARQRGELAHAYRDLERPIRYAEYGMKGIGFLRSNPWIFAAVPAALSVASTLWNFGKQKPSRPAPVQSQKIESAPKGVKGHVRTWAGHGWRLYQLYRRVRRYLP
jgi:hypothetical protein